MDEWMVGWVDDRMDKWEAEATDGIVERKLYPCISNVKVWITWSSSLIISLVNTFPGPCGMCIWT